MSESFLNAADVLDIFKEMLQSFSEGLFYKILVNDYFSTCTGSRSEVFHRKGVVKNFAKSTVKHLCPQLATLLEKRVWHRCFPVKFVNFLGARLYRRPPGVCFWSSVVPVNVFFYSAYKPTEFIDSF